MRFLTITAIGLGILSTLAHARTTPVQVVPYKPGEVTITIEKQTDTLAFSNGITVEIRPFEVHPAIVTNNCIDGQKALCMVVREKSTTRCGIRPEFPFQHLYPGTSLKDTALLAFGLNADTVWEEAKRVPNVLIDSVSSLPHRRALFGLPVYYREAGCTMGFFCLAYEGKAPSRSMVMYATRANASMKLQISQIEFGSSLFECSMTPERVWMTSEHFKSATIRWVADSAGNRQFAPTTSVAPRSPAPAFQADGVRIQQSPNRRTIRFALSNSSPTEVTILDARGVVVTRLSNQRGAPSSSCVEWDAATRAKPGIYLARITTGTNTVSRSFMIAR